MKKLISAILTIILTLIVLLQPISHEVQAATNYINVKTFVQNLVEAMKLPLDKSFPEPYIAAAVSAGILKSTDFNNKFTGDITRTDAAVLLNRADEYLHGDTVDVDLLKIVLEKRISDIKKVPKAKREAVAKCFVKGIFQGNSNGYYIKNRAFKGSEKLTKTEVTTLINKVMKPSKRAKLSPDGMLIRTIKLPKNANKYDYILACYPNEFYERQFEFMLFDKWKDASYKPYFAYPVGMKDRTFKNWYNEWPLSEEMDKHLYEWADLADKYLNYIFNVDYRTVDDKWIEGLGALYAKSNRNEADDIRTFYIDYMKANKVIIESSIVAVEPSTFYEDSSYCMRAYVRYRINADDLTIDQSRILYSQYPYLSNLISGEWRTGIFDVRFRTNDGSNGDGSDFSINPMTSFVDAYNMPFK